jgi:2-aminoadipate transaminase
LQTFDSYEVRYESAPLDPEGVDDVRLCDALRQLDAQRQHGLLFVLPNFQNPTGLTLNGLRRMMIAECAGMLRIPVLEDDAYYDLRFEGEHERPVAALIRGGPALYTGTFSKTIAPGLRVGWIYGSEEVIAKLAQLKQITDLHSGSLAQRIAFEFCARGHLEPQIARICETYRGNRDVMLAALQLEMPEGVRWTKPQGGMFVFVELPSHFDSAELLRRALEQKVMFVPGRSFFPPDSNQPEAGRNTLRLNFVSPTTEEIDRGVTTLARLVRS